MSTASATVKIGASIQGLSTGIAQAKGALSNFASQAAAIAGGQALFSGIQSAVGLVARGVQGLKSTFSEAITEAGNFESITAQFQTFYKDADLAAGAVAELARYSATTSFQLSEVAGAGAGLAAAGVPAEQLKETIRVLGDIAAGTRKPLAEILQPYVKTLSVGKLQTEGFLQFLERGIPIGEELKKALNLSDAGLQKALSDGKVSAQDMVTALQQMTNTGLFSGAAAAQGQTLNGLLSTLADNVEEVKRNLGLAASVGLKPLIEFAQQLIQRFAPLGTALGNVFTAATKKALSFSEQFSAGFGQAVDTALKTFQIVEGAIQNGTLWDILVASGKLAFLEVQTVALRALQGLTEVFEGADLIGSLAPVADAFIDRVVNAGPRIGAALESPLGQAFIRATDAFASYLKQQIEFAISGLADLVLPSFLAPKNANDIGRGMQMSGMTGDLPVGFASGGITAAQANEIRAAKAAGYPTPLTPGEVRETFAGGRRITYNTKESLSNGAIIPPSNSDAFAEGTPGQGIVAAFERGFGRQTAATERLQAQNEKLRAELQKLTEAALKNATALREQSSSLKSTSQLTAKAAQAEEKKTQRAAQNDKQFTSLEKIGGGARRINLSSKNIIPLEGASSGLKAAGDLRGGFASSPAFVKARQLSSQQIQGPPMPARPQAEDYATSLNRRLEKQGSATPSQPSPLSNQFSTGQTEMLLNRLIRVTETLLNLQTRTLEAPAV